MTVKELLLDCAEDSNLQGDGSLNPRTRARLLRYLNEGLRRVLAMPGMQKLIDTDPPFTFATVANTARYVIPESVSIARIVTERTNDSQLHLMTLDDYREFAPDPTAVTGTPTHYVPIGRVALATLPSDASELFVKSTSSSDVYEAYVRGVITSGYERSAAVLMTGTTGVSVSSAITSWIDVADFYVGNPAAGTITLLEDSASGTELARITIGQTRPRYFGFYLYPTPSAAITYYVDGKRRSASLVRDEDEPPWDEDFHWVLSAYARMRQCEKTSDPRYQIAEQAWDDGTKQLRSKTLFPPGTSVVAGTTELRRSNLGSFYPPGIW